MPKEAEVNASFQSFEDSLLFLFEKGKKEPISIRTFLTILSGKGKLILLIFLCLPFGQIPGISIFSGLLMCFLGVRMAFNSSHIWLPERILLKKTPPFILKRVLSQLIHFFKFMKKWTKPRYISISKHFVLKRFHGIVIALLGLALSVAPPIPLLGTIAFLAIFLIGIGLLNDDGVYVILGYVCSLAYFSCVLLGLKFLSIPKMIGFFSDLLK